MDLKARTSRRSTKQPGCRRRHFPEFQEPCRFEMRSLAPIRYPTPMRPILRLAAGLIASLTLFVSTPTFAQNASVYVLGIRSIEGDDDFARDLSGAIRVGAARVPGWEVAPDEVSLSQMTMMHGCADPDVSCMTAIAQELSADKIIYGTVRRAGASDNYDFALSLYMFDAAEATIADQLSDTISQAESDIDQLRERANRYAAQLGGQARYGSLRLEAGEAGALVRVDGEDSGTTNAAGTILIEDLAEGEHQVEIVANDFDPFSTTVSISADEQTEVRANLTSPDQGDGPNLGWVPGAALIAGGAVAMVFGAVSGAKVSGWQGEVDDIDHSQVDTLAQCVMNNPTTLDNNSSIDCGGGVTVTRSQALVLTTPQGEDACSSPGEGWRSDTFDEHTRHKRLQWALYGVGIASIGVGTFLLLRSLGGDDDDEEEAASGADVSVTPWMAGRDGGLDMTVRW